jgi:hypothetical protein
MLVKRLDVCHYLTAWSWNLDKFRDPTWPQIEDAIRRLDRFHYPWVWLRLIDQESDDNYMTVMGGNGAFWLSISVNGYDQRRVFFPGQGDEEVDLWTSDQGFVSEKSRVCFDLAAVLSAAKYFAEHADFDPSLPWEPQDWVVKK